jgi:hypothetical protein
MTAEIFNLASKRPAYFEGKARCPDCLHGWTAQLEVTKPPLMECPECHCHRASWVYPILRGNLMWECKCGFELFRINEIGAYCVRCGSYKVNP